MAGEAAAGPEDALSLPEGEGYAVADAVAEEGGDVVEIELACGNGACREGEWRAGVGPEVEGACVENDAFFAVDLLEASGACWEVEPEEWVDGVDAFWVVAEVFEGGVFVDLY